MFIKIKLVLERLFQYDKKNNAEFCIKIIYFEVLVKYKIFCEDGYILFLIDTQSQAHLLFTSK